MPRHRKEKEKEKDWKAKDDLERDPRIAFKLIKMTRNSRKGNRSGVGPNGNGGGVKVKVQLFPETRLLLALANEEVGARRRDGQSEEEIWRDCRKAPRTFVKAGFKRLLSALGRFSR